VEESQEKPSKEEEIRKGFELDEETAKLLGDDKWEVLEKEKRLRSLDEFGMSPDRPHLPKPKDYPFTLDIANSFPVQAMWAWDKTLGPSVENKMYHTRYMEILKSKEPKIGRRYD